MDLTDWKSFQFFTVSEIHFGAADDSSPFTGDISGICTGSENVFLGTEDGTVRILSRAFKVIRSFKAYETGSITHLKQVEGTSLLVTVAEDLSQDPILKVWSLDKLERKTGTPRCQSTVAIQNAKRRFPITAFSALDDLSQVAVGFANGAVTIVRGDLIHDRGTKQRIVFESEEPVTGIQFRDWKTTALYIATTSRILTLIISGHGQGQPARTVDDKGCALACMTIDKTSQEVIVARDDAIYYYRLHGPVSCYSCAGHKSLAKAHKDYVALASPSPTPPTNRNSSLGALAAVKAQGSPDSSTFLILNIDFRFIAHREMLPSRVKHCFAEWGDLFVLTDDGKLFRYHEKPLKEQFEILFERDLYLLAIQMAKKAEVSTEQLSAIYRRYGDYLYPNDSEAAMHQYLRAIDNTEPSQIIRKYLDTPRIPNLIEYLEELHNQKRASSDHTILLLNCYAKLKDVDKLEAFIKAPGESNFDLDTAISMCRQGGYFDQAAYLARKHLEHDIVISILIEDSKKYAEALAYIWRLEPELAFKNLFKYATVLLEHCPEDTTQIFIEYYTGKFQPKKDAVVVSAAPATQSSGIAATAVQNLASLIPLPYMNLDSFGSTNSGDQKTETRVVESQADEPPPKYDVPRPRGAFSAFLDHPDQFIEFLEACIAADALSEEEKSDVYTTLFEMYLRKANEDTSEGKIEWQAKAKKLLEHKDIPVDTLNVLLLSDLEHFRDGTVLVREQQGLRFDIFRAYASANDTAGVIKALKKYGPNEPQLYPAALAYFTASSQNLQEAGGEFDAVLRKIDEDGLLAPLQVIQVLSGNAVATMGLVKKYLQNTIGRERNEIAKNRKMINTYRVDSVAKRAELEKLTSEPQTLKANRRCSVCNAAVTQPSVHFMCEHSYHQGCLSLSGGDTFETVECPKCAPQNTNIRAIKKAQIESRDQHDLFKERLGRSRDRYGTVAEFFGRGVMSVSSND